MRRTPNRNRRVPHNRGPAAGFSNRQMERERPIGRLIRLGRPCGRPQTFLDVEFSLLEDRGLGPHRHWLLDLREGALDGGYELFLAKRFWQPSERLGPLRAGPRGLIRHR